MSGTTGTIPLVTVVADQLITSAERNAEFVNIGALMDAAGCGGHSDTDTDAQLQTNPFPGSVLSKAASIAGELERIRFQIAAMLGTDFWYKAAPSDLTTLGAAIVPIGGTFEYPVATPPNSNYHLADGTAISRAAYPTLFTLIGTTFGIGDGVSTFNLPDYRDRFAVGAGTTYPIGTTGGAVSHTHTQTAHSHTVAAHHHTIAHQHVLPFGYNNADGDFYALASGDYGSSSFSHAWARQAMATGGPSVIPWMLSQDTNTANSGDASPATDSQTPPIASASSIPPYLAIYKMIRIL